MPCYCGQVPENHRPHSSKAISYWKLSCIQHHTIQTAEEALRDLNFEFSASANKARLLKLLHRAERGSLSYDTCSERELLRFIKDRKLTGLPHERNAGKGRLISFLEQADDYATFNSFVSLPVELRMVVYDHHFASLPIVALPVQPPVSMVSRLLRKETLPAFYQKAHIKFKIKYHGGWEPEPPYTYERHAGAFLKHPPVGFLANTRYLQVSAEHWILYNFNMSCMFETCVYNVDFVGGKCEVTRQLPHRVLPTVLDLNGQDACDPVVGIFREIWARCAAVKLRTEDFKQILKVWKEYHGRYRV